MIVLLLGTGLGLLCLPALARRPGRLLAPAEWARLCVAALILGAALVELSALLWAAPTVSMASGLPKLAVLCERMLGSLAPGGPIAGWTAAVVAVALPTLGATAWVRVRRVAKMAMIEPCLGQRSQWGAYEVVTLPADELVAFSVPVRSGTGQIVVSDGLAAVLEPAELAAVLRHEASHLDNGHDRYLRVAAVINRAFMWCPPVRRSVAALRVALERWADEDAAGDTVEDRRALRGALISVASNLVHMPGLAGFSAADTIVERVASLSTNAVRPRRWVHALLYVPGAAIGASALLALGSWLAAAQAVLAMAGQCAM